MNRWCRQCFIVLITVMCLGTNTVSVAQNAEQAAHRIDSMKRQLAVSSGDTAKMRLLNTIAFTYYTIHPDSGIVLARQSLQLAEKLNDSSGIADAYRALGANYWEKNDFGQSQKFSWQSLKITERIGDSFGIARSLHNIATNYTSQYNFLKAIEYHRRSLNMYRHIGNTDGELGCLANIADIYEILGNYDSAIAYYTQSLSVCRRSSTQRDAAYMLGRIGFMHAKKKNTAYALRLEKEALVVFERLGYNNDLGNTLSEIAGIYVMQHQPDTALMYYRKAIDAYNRLHDNYFARQKAKDMAAAGNLYMQMVKDKTANRSEGLQKAAFLLRQAIDTALHQHEPEALRDAYQALSEVQEMQGNYKASLVSYQHFISYKDSLNNVANDKENARHELEYVYDKQKDSLNHINDLQMLQIRRFAEQKELAELHLSQFWLYGMLVIAVLCIASLLFFFRYRTQGLQLKHQMQAEKAGMQLKEAEYQRHLNELSFAALRSQMNPHFIFNALNTIQSYVYANDKRTAGNYLGKFSELIRKILDDSNKETVSIVEEIELLQLYIDIEKARFGNELQANIYVSPQLPLDDIFIPSMLVQPYVENAIKHGLLHKTGEKRLTISMHFSEPGDEVVIMIDDNGIGRGKSAELRQKKESHRSFAVAANEKRIDLLNRVYSGKANITIADKTEPDGQPAGTCVTVRIPFNLYRTGKSSSVYKPSVHG